MVYTLSDTTAQSKQWPLFRGRYKARDEFGDIESPCAFESDALHRFDQGLLESGLSTSVVGLPGRAISNEPTDVLMRQQLVELENSKGLEALTSTLTSDSGTNHRTLWAFKAQERACVQCHNRIQSLVGDDAWQVGDMMGAQVVNQDIGHQMALVFRNAIWFSTLVFVSVVAVLYCGLFIFRHLQSSRELKVMATTDSMTGCINRREMYERINKLSDPTSGALLLLDIDHFKTINDTHGHAVGDTVIKKFATEVKKGLRSGDWVARIGGEEFVVWLPNVGGEIAVQIAERLRSSVESLSVDLDESKLNYTVSIGLHVVEDAAPSQFDSWINAADTLLYRAKNEGRNRVVMQQDNARAA